MKRNPWHQIGCMCPLCTPRSPADADTGIRARLIVAGIAIAATLLAIAIIHWRAS
ncbi:MAG: hypothetical protein ACTHM0_13500 [Sphingomonas sp.]